MRVLNEFQYKKNSFYVDHKKKNIKYIDNKNSMWTTSLACIRRPLFHSMSIHKQRDTSTYDSIPSKHFLPEGGDECGVEVTSSHTLV